MYLQFVLYEPTKPAQHYAITQLLKHESAGGAEWRKRKLLTVHVTVKGNVNELFISKNQIQVDKQHFLWTYNAIQQSFYYKWLSTREIIIMRSAFINGLVQ